MAIFTAGGVVGQASGRLAGVVFSHNKGGPYMRNGTFPTQPDTDYKAIVKERLTRMSMMWDDLDEEQRTSWRSYAAVNPIINRLGKAVHMSGNAIFVAINTRVVATGPLTNFWNYALEVPPAGVAPSGFITSSVTYDVGVGTVALTFDPPTLGATERIFVYAAVTTNKGIRFVKNLYKLAVVSAQAATTPLDLEAGIEARFGTLAVGQHLWLKVFIHNRGTGLSGPLTTFNGLIVST